MDTGFIGKSTEYHRFGRKRMLSTRSDYYRYVIPAAQFHESVIEFIIFVVTNAVVKDKIDYMGILGSVDKGLTDRFRNSLGRGFSRFNNLGFNTNDRHMVVQYFNIRPEVRAEEIYLGLLQRLIPSNTGDRAITREGFVAYELFNNLKQMRLQVSLFI